MEGPLDQLAARWKDPRALQQDSEYALKVWGGARANPEWDTFLDLVDLALHNYIASVIALADHTSKVADRVLQGESHSLYRGEYNTRFREDPRSSFVRGLRNYLLHRALPITSGSFHFEKGGPFTHAIMLSVEALADDDGWNPEALKFMDEAGEGLDIYETLLAHYNDTRSFQKWFETLVFDANKEAIAEANEIADRRSALIPPVREELAATTHDGVDVPDISGSYSEGAIVGARRISTSTNGLGPPRAKGLSPPGTPDSHQPADDPAGPPPRHPRQGAEPDRGSTPQKTSR